MEILMEKLVESEYEIGSLEDSEEDEECGSMVLKDD
jgi:hypothetical protein